ncbi:MAG: AAA family ATPase [Bacteroidales bacterium]|nr:AAA family ATPase [Bacteroidales bacterium]
MSKITKIVLTGGPCAGKTTALAHIVELFSGMGYYVLTVPEAATLFTQSGVNFLTSDKDLFLQSERQLMEFQLELEDRLVCIGESSGKPVLVVCDRGTMDIRAYLSDQMWNALLDTLGTTVVELRDARYDAVIHMSTAAKGAEKFYTLANNAARSESPEQACAIDDKLMSAWTGHPHLRVIGNDCGFEEKIARVLKEISHVLGVPQPIEVERKYLVDVVGEIAGGNVSDIHQTYLLPVDGKERRLRMRGENGHNVYFLTTKIRLAADRNYEHECQIDENQYKELLQEANPEKRTIYKRRCCFLWENQYFELDKFIEPEIGHYLLEIEDAEDPATVKFPPFLRILEDVTGDPAYYNSNIAKR